MSSSEFFIEKRFLHLFSQLKQTDTVCNGGPFLPDSFRQFFLSNTGLFQQEQVGFGFFNGIQVLTLDILDQGDFHSLHITKSLDYNRYLFQPNRKCCTISSLTGYNSVVVITNLLN